MVFKPISQFFCVGEGRGGALPWGQFVVVRIEKSLRWLIYIYFILYFVFIDIRPWDAPDPSKGYIGKFALSMRMAGPLQMYRWTPMMEHPPLPHGKRVRKVLKAKRRHLKKGEG